MDCVAQWWLLAVGSVAQGALLVRWLCRSCKEVQPGYGYVGLTGGLLLLGYAAMRRDVVLLVAQGAVVLVYLRCLILFHRPSASAAKAG